MGEGGGVFADASLVEAHAPLAIERDTPNPKAGKGLLRRLAFGDRFDIGQYLPGGRYIVASGSRNHNRGPWLTTQTYSTNRLILRRSV